MFAALSVVFSYFIHLPIIPSAPFLEYDPADIPLLIAGFAYGPVWGFILTVVTSIIQGVTVSSSGGPWGVVMHICATGSLVMTSSVIYYMFKTKKGALMSLIAGSLVMCTLMVPLNILIDPLYLGTDRAAVTSFILPAILPFNVIKAAINCTVTFLIYKKISRLIK